MIVVSNTTPIISLSSINKINLLEEIFKKIYIPIAVYNEIRAKNSYGFSEIEENFFIIKPITNSIYKNILLKDLDEGEAETITLALEMKAEIILIDERLAYKIAKSLSLNPIGTISVLIEAKRRNLIKNLKNILEEMVVKGRWYSKNVLNEVLKSVGEI